MELSRARQKNGISLEDVAEKTKISPRYLLAIESEEYHQLPGGLFALSYLRQYAEAVKIDPEVLLRRYHEKTKPALTESKKPVGRADARSLLDRLFRVSPLPTPPR